MYTSRFFERNTPDQDRSRLEGRLAAALDIDQANRVLNHSQSPEPVGRSGISNTNGSPSKSSSRQNRTTWRDGQWQQEGDLLCKDYTPFRESYGICIVNSARYKACADSKQLLGGYLVMKYDQCQSRLSDQ